MKKKFLVPILGLFVFALAFSFSTSSTASSNDETASFFVESDNIAYAEEGSVPCVQDDFFCKWNGYGYPWAINI